jgi:hypothetical protein
MRNTIRGAVLVAVAALALGAVAGPSFAGGSGDVKVTGATFDSIPNNAPHQDCQFNVEFYNFDLGSPNAHYTFTLTSPTGDLVLKQGDVVVGSGPLPGYDRLDARVNVDLSPSLAASGAAPDAQGFHVRLDVTGTAVQGGAKSKTFWVGADCGGTLPG